MTTTSGFRIWAVRSPIVRRNCKAARPGKSQRCYPVDYVIDLVIIGLSVGMVYALVALGISLIFSGLDIVHFAHGEIYMFGAFIGLMLFQKLALPYVPTLLLAIILTGLLGVLIERLFYRRLTRAGGGYTVAGMGMIIAGFGMSIVLQNL